MTKTPEVITSFYNWEGDACRLHEHADGQETADLYRGGKGLLPINPSDIHFCATEISEATYQELVLEEIARRKRKGQA
jgi:hypothetical protein